MKRQMIQNYCRNFFLIFYVLLLPVASDGCTFTSANSTTFTVGKEGVFNVTTSPQGRMSMTGAPDWLHLDKNAEGTSYILHGIPLDGAASSYSLTFTSDPTSSHLLCLLSCEDVYKDDPAGKKKCKTDCVTFTSTCSQNFTLNVTDVEGSIPNSPKDITVNQVSSTGQQIRAKAHPKDISFQNVISWKAPKQRSKIVSYRVYTGDRFENLLLTIIPSSDKKRFRVIDPNANPCHIQRYHVVSVDKFGNVSEPASAKIKGTKRDCALFKREAKEESDSSSSDH